MQLRRLHKDIEGYAPPAVLARHLNQTHAFRASEISGAELHNSDPWWKVPGPTPNPEDNTSADLVRVRTHAEEIEDLTTPKGLLITGPPGSGKSFVIDLWFSTVPTPYKARKHYSELVLEIYRAVWEETRYRMTASYSSESASHTSSEPSRPWNNLIRDQWRQFLKSGLLPSRWKRQPNMSFSLSRTPVEPSIAYVVAQRLILRHWLLVFDEIQLLDVSSATLLADVLSWFWRMGGIIVGSSNKVPDDLYKNGVQRERLEPFVEALKARCPVVVMRSEKDWRAVRGSGGQKTWYTQAHRSQFEAQVAEILGAKPEPTSEDITVFGRKIHVPWSFEGICKFSFSELCDASLGPADYITLAARYHTFIITSIPILKLSAKNQARRFISLIDALYEARCRLICLAEATPEELFFPDAPAGEAPSIPAARESPDTLAASVDVDVMMAEAVGETQDVYRPNVSSYDAPNMERERIQSAPLALDKLSIFSGKDEQFAFKRALSRLLEMTSESYARDEQWNPLPASARKWETPSSSHALPHAPSSTSSQPLSTQREHPYSSRSSTSDFADEAFAHPSHPSSFDRPPAPRLSADHIWGVREDWGPRARDWGRGARVYSESAPSRTPPPGPREDASEPADDARPSGPGTARRQRAPSAPGPGKRGDGGGGGSGTS
ncbi:hypothetical protein PYCCODRAFT_1464084 [Trametes coccinea BRFM310]|uniref:AFG1-like ATPase n=1 Tax=Trametes coccinea (strain BRFM310) TaxID=1353009 RepID=A0A1Y2J0L6_TRAC3|nr:hypothetical protein PYCCODRAFT_1464084 [Trametes coccinea BRFM310]